MIPDAVPAQVPDRVLALAPGAPVRLVWRNELGGLTYRLGDGPDRSFLKWAPDGSGLDLAGEAARMRWAGAYRPVPRVLDSGREAGGTWLLTAGLPGESGVSARWQADPAAAVRAIGAGLRAFHDALPVASCPFTRSVQERLADARVRAAAGRIDPARWAAEYRPLGVAVALERLADPPPVDMLVVCHGDTCPPNTLIGEDGTCSGHVDLGLLGVADRWSDLAIATWSATWDFNYGPGWDAVLLDAYGIDPDPERTEYYRLLWQLGP